MNKHKSKPMFSVITVCFNEEKSIERTILSLLNQSYKDFEYIVIDGASKDNTVKIINKYKDKIDCFVSEKDTGLYSAMNKGVKAAKGEYLYFLNGGDYFEGSNILEEVAEKMKQNNPDLLYGSVRVIKSDGEKGYVKGKFLNKYLLRLGCKVGQQAVFVKREIFNKVEGLDEKYKVAADFDLLCKILETNPSVERINKVICNFDSSGISSDLKKSYQDTAQVVKDRYGKFWFSIYSVFSTLKLVVARVYFSIKDK